MRDGAAICSNTPWKPVISDDANRLSRSRHSRLTESGTPWRPTLSEFALAPKGLRESARIDSTQLHSLRLRRTIFRVSGYQERRCALPAAHRARIWGIYVKTFRASLSRCAVECSLLRDRERGNISLRGAHEQADFPTQNSSRDSGRQRAGTQLGETDGATWISRFSRVALHRHKRTRSVPVRMGVGTWKALSHRRECGQIAGSATPPDSTSCRVLLKTQRCPRMKMSLARDRKSIGGCSNFS